MKQNICLLPNDLTPSYCFPVVHMLCFLFIGYLVYFFMSFCLSVTSFISSCLSVYRLPCLFLHIFLTVLRLHTQTFQIILRHWLLNMHLLLYYFCYCSWQVNSWKADDKLCLCYIYTNVMLYTALEKLHALTLYRRCYNLLLQLLSYV